MANCWKKLKINKLTVVNCELMADKVGSGEIEYWERCAKFLGGIKDLDHVQLSKGQKDYALKIKLDLTTEGY